METGTEGLWLAGAVVALAAAALSAIGWRAQRHRGWLHWLAALWCAAAGTALSAAVARHGLIALLPAQLLLLAWPLLTLTGVRRFHGRIEWPTSSRVDAAVYGFCAALVVGGPLWPAEAEIGPLSAPLAMLVVQLYVASLLWAGSSRPDGPPMRLLAALFAIAAMAPMLSLRPGMDVQPVIGRAALVAAFAALAMAFVAVTLVIDRRERQWRASRRRLRALSQLDPLTRVPDRRRFEDLVGRALAHDAPGSAVLLLFDIDHFRSLNDRFGHAAGDRALRLVSHCLTQSLRGHDVPGRRGGDQFVLLLRNASVGEGMLVAGRLVDRLHAARDEARLPSMTLSFGVVQVRPLERIEDALRRADQALDEAKRQGRSRAVAATGNESRPVFSESRPLGLSC